MIRLIIISFFFSFYSLPLLSQCLDTETTSSNEGGYFDNSNWNSSHWYSANTEGSITLDTDDFYYGSGSLKAVVSSSDDYSNDKVRMWTRNGNCPITISNNQSWNVSFYIKGDIGAQIEFVLIDGNSYGTSLGNASYSIAYNGWHYMRLNITATNTGSSGTGRLRVNFKSPGTYNLDNIVLEQETAFNNWYIDDGGNNNNNGTDPSSAFKTIKKAILQNNNYNPGDLIHVRAGTYQNYGYDVSDDTYSSNSDNGSHSDNYAYITIASTTKYDADGNGNNTSAGDLVFLDNKNGSINRPVVIRNYVDDNGNHETPKIQFDGRGGIVVGAKTKPIQHFELAGFEIQGPNDYITYTEAKDNRDRALADRVANTTYPTDDDGNVTGQTVSSEGTDVDRSFFHGRGIAVWGGFYVNIHNNTVWDCPNSGIRVDNGDYIRIFNNVVYDNTFWSYNAESGIVIAQSLNRDGITNNPTTIKMRIENNIAYGNINKIPYFNSTYECKVAGSYTYNSTSDDYACGGQNYIHDGSGVYITRNRYNSGDTSGSNPNETDYIGGFLFANNLSYGNGMNGVVVHKTNNASVFNNTVHENGEVPTLGSTESGYSASGIAWKDALQVGRQNYTGIVIHSSSDSNIKNNISWARNSDDISYVNYLQTDVDENNNSIWTSSNVDFGTNANPKNLAGPSVNIAGGNQSLNDNIFSQANPQFVDAAGSLGSRNYKLSNSSTAAIDQGDDSLTNNLDFDLNNLSRPQGGAYDYGAYEHQNTWTGSTDTDWSTATNWSTNDIPVSGRSPIITDVTNQPIISSDDGSSGDVTLKDITINSGAELTINKEASLTLSRDFTNNSGTVTLNSDSNEFSAIIVLGTSTGNITYNRWVNSVSNGSGWDLIGSPVSGLSISSFASDNDSPLATGGGSGSNQYAIGTFDNTQSSSAAAWSNYTSDGAGSTTNISVAGNFTKGKGYQMATDSGATLAFTGTIDTDATETIPVESFTDASGYRWNLISNPYPSYIIIGPNTTNDTFLKVNDDVIDATYVGVYGYDANTDGDGSGELFDVYNNTSSAKIAPGQAFMVAARSTTAANIIFKEEMQTVSGSDDFISGDIMQNSEVELRIYNDDTGLGKTKLFFDEGLSMGLDRGWDAGHYYENASIMTRLVEEDEGHGMAINAMGLDAMENAIIPLVINQSAGQEFRVNLHTATITNPNIYFQDIEEGTFTNLYEEDFILTPTTDLSGVGRFFIHMSADTMSNEDVSTSMLNAYKEVNANYITLEGLATQSNNINVSLYNILGRELFSTTLNNNMNTQTISTLGMAAGIYVIEVESGTDRLTKKLIIQ